MPMSSPAARRSTRCAPRLPGPGRLLRGALPERGRPARGRPGRAQPRPPPGLAEQRLRRRLSGGDAPGGGCQFTFTCDGSLATRPSGAELGAGAAHRRRGARRPHLSRRSASRPIITPITSSRPGRRGWSRPPRSARTSSTACPASPARPAPSATPMRAPSRSRARPDPVLPPPARSADMTALAISAGARCAPPRRRPPTSPQQARWTPSNLPESTIREEHRQSGQWRTDAPAAVTGR